MIRCCDSPMFVLKTADFIKCQKGIFDNNQQKGDLMSKNNRRKATMKQPRTGIIERTGAAHKNIIDDILYSCNYISKRLRSRPSHLSFVNTFCRLIRDQNDRNGRVRPKNS